MSDTYFRMDGWVQTPTGDAVAGASVAVLDQPANLSGQPGSPLAAIFAEPNVNTVNITGASWLGQQITFQLASIPSDLIVDSYIATAAVNPSGYNSTAEAPWLVVGISGLNVTVTALTNPGAYVSGGTATTGAIPNPLSTDGNGHYFFYTLPGLYSVQVYGSDIFEQDYPDQGVGTVAGGSVTSVGLIGDGVLFASSISGSPVNSTGSFDLATSIVQQAANKVFAGPTSGGNANPTFRSLVAADIPSLTFVSSVAFTLSVPSSVFTESVGGSPITTTGTIAATLGLQTQSANEVWAGPSTGAAAQPTFRALVAADIPTLGYSSFSSTLFVGGQQDAVQNASGSADAVTFPGSTFVTTAAVDAMTLATPASPGDNGKKLYIVDTTGHAHTVTTASNVIAPSHHLLTFGGTIGNFVELEAFGGLWFVKAIVGVTPS